MAATIRARRLVISTIFIAAVLGSVILSAGAQAAPGDLDPTFSADGMQRTNFGFGHSSAAATVLQPDGKIVAVGTQFSSQDFDFAITRYNSNGSLDTSFSGDGKLTTDFGGLDLANGVALQGDGKIVAVGRGGGNGDFALARYNPNGSLDTSFSGDGKQTTDFGPDDEATGVAIQANGNIVVVGFTESGPGGGDFALARYNPNGSLDPSFSGDGTRRTDFGGDDQANGVALQGDGKIVAVGGGDAGGDNPDFDIARYNSNGSLDTSFSGDGKLTTDFGGLDLANGVALQGGGKIVAVGVSRTGTSRTGSFALARYNPNGSLDPSFSGDGKQTTDFGDDDVATGVAIQSDGKIVVVGGGGGGDDFALARYNPNGTLDFTFSGDGKQTTDLGGEDEANTVALQANGKIIAVGEGEGGNSGFALARYNPNGTLDTSFSGDGKQTTPFAGHDEAQGVAIQEDGKIVVVGHGFAIARYNPNGSLDTSFSGDGKRTTTDFGGFGEDATAVAIQDDGKIIVVGSVAGPMLYADFAIARYNPNGTLDTSFNGAGRQQASFVGHDEAHGVAIQGDGKIVVVGSGYDTVTGASEGALVRYNPNGTIDTTFSGDGKLTTDFGRLEWGGDPRRRQDRYGRRR